MLDLIEQLTETRARLRSIEAEWDDMRAQIRKGYQRMEKAYERSQEPCPDGEPKSVGADMPSSIPEAARGFASKLRAIKGV